MNAIFLIFLLTFTTAYAQNPKKDKDKEKLLQQQQQQQIQRQHRQQQQRPQWQVQQRPAQIPREVNTTRSPSLSREALKIPQKRTQNQNTKNDFKEYFKSAKRSLDKDQLQQKQQDIKATFNKNKQSQQQTVRKIEQRHPQYRQWFDNNFFDRHHYRPNYNHGGKYWRRPVPWIVINNFLPYGWSNPIYYDGGYPIPVPPTLYAPPSGAPVVPQEEWLPLGVFTTARDVNQATFSNMFLQLALNKLGDIAGTYYNSASDTTTQINGMVDDETQIAAWKLSDAPDAPMMTTGLFNLTQDIVTIQVYFPDGIVQDWVLVRLNDNE